MSYLEKVEAERKELSEKITKLEAYLDGEEQIGSGHRKACISQLYGMRQYLTSLNHRISYLRMDARRVTTAEEPESDEFDANEAVNCNIDDIVVEGRTSEQLEAMLDAEKTGENRKGAIERIEGAKPSSNETNVV